jgi:hypothetical protein
VKNAAIKLFGVVVGLTLFFTYIGVYFLPQSESHPPKELKIKEGVSSDELVAIGEGIIFSKGQCMVCHPMKAETGMRSPAIATIGADSIVQSAKHNMTPEDYLFEALVNPDKTIREGFEKMMPAIDKSPTSLNEGELIAVVAFLQSKGSKVTVSYPGSVAALKKQIAIAAGGK